ncbi:MAG: DUF2948 family protein [Alphaproteobacteria bacterium]|nr:DUF2948 family protein [Alphaproteobacteria bacterium]
MLKLRAGDAEDIQVISAVLQDAIVPVCDMAFQPESNAFVLVAQRLRREDGEGGEKERICCALTVRGVVAVQKHGIDQHQGERMLDLLAILFEPSGHLSLIFAGDARIRLELGAWSATVEDFGESWPALCRPCHEARE